jgi:hypothetical protein
MVTQEACTGEGSMAACTIGAPCTAVPWACTISRTALHTVVAMVHHIAMVHRARELWGLLGKDHQACHPRGGRNGK